MEVFLQEAAALRHAPSHVVSLFEYSKNNYSRTRSFCGSCVRLSRRGLGITSQKKSCYFDILCFDPAKSPNLFIQLACRWHSGSLNISLILPSGSINWWLLSHCGCSWWPFVYYQNWVLDSKLAPIHLDKWALQERDLQEWTLERHEVKTTKYSSLPVRQKECLCHAFEFLLFIHKI